MGADSMGVMGRFSHGQILMGATPPQAFNTDNFFAIAELACFAFLRMVQP